MQVRSEGPARADDGDGARGHAEAAPELQVGVGARRGAARGRRRRREQGGQEKGKELENGRKS